MILIPFYPFSRFRCTEAATIVSLRIKCELGISELDGRTKRRVCDSINAQERKEGDFMASTQEQMNRGGIFGIIEYEC